MKKIVIILSAFILFIGACKKDKNEPESSQGVNASLQARLFDMFNGKEITWANNWRTQFTRGYTVFAGCDNKADSLYYHDSTDIVLSTYSDWNPRGRTNSTDNLVKRTIYIDSDGRLGYSPVSSASGFTTYLTDTNFSNQYFVYSQLVLENDFNIPQDSLAIVQFIGSKEKVIEFDSLEVCAKGGTYYLGFDSLTTYWLDRIYLPKSGVGNVYMTSNICYNGINTWVNYYSSQDPCGSPIDSSYISAAAGWHVYSYGLSHFNRFSGETWHPASQGYFYSVGSLN